MVASSLPVHMNGPNRGLLLFYGFWVLVKTDEFELVYEVVISCIIGEAEMDGRGGLVLEFRESYLSSLGITKEEFPPANRPCLGTVVK